MRAILLRRAAILLPLVLAACGDLPTARPMPDLSDAGPALSGDCTRQADGSYRCPPISSDPGDECDPYHYDCGGDDCIASTGPGNPEAATVQGCTGGGGGGGGTIGDPNDPGGDGGGGSGGTKPAPRCPDWDPNCSYEEPEPDTCVTNDPVIDDPVVEAAFTELWANSNPSAPQYQRVEQAAWIVQTASGLSVVTWTNADFGPCTISPHIGAFSIPTGAIAWIHTHPFTEGEVQTSCEPIGYDANGQPIHGTYDKFPNEEDIELAGLINQSLGRNIDAYTIDQGNIVRFLATGTTTVSSYSPYGRCGY